MTYANKKKKKNSTQYGKRKLNMMSFHGSLLVIFNQFSVPLGKPQKKVLILMAGVRP